MYLKVVGKDEKMKKPWLVSTEDESTINLSSGEYFRKKN